MRCLKWKWMCVRHSFYKWKSILCTFGQTATGQEWERGTLAVATVFLFQMTPFLQHSLFMLFIIFFNQSWSFSALLIFGLKVFMKQEVRLVQTKTAAETQTLGAGSDCLVSAAEAGRPAAQAQTRWRQSAADRCVLGAGRQAIESPGLHRPTGCQVPQRAGAGHFHRVGQAERCQRPRERRATMADGMAASQTGLPYCSDKRTGRRGGGGRTRGSHTCSCRQSYARCKMQWTNRGRDLKKVWPRSQQRGRARKWQTKAPSWHSVSNICTEQMCLLVHSHMELREIWLQPERRGDAERQIGGGEQHHHVLNSNVCHPR